MISEETEYPFIPPVPALLGYGEITQKEIDVFIDRIIKDFVKFNKDNNPSIQKEVSKKVYPPRLFKAIKDLI